MKIKDLQNVVFDAQRIRIRKENGFSADGYIEDIAQEFGNYEIQEMFTTYESMLVIIVKDGVSDGIEDYTDINSYLIEKEGEQWLADLYNELLDKFD